MLGLKLIHVDKKEPREIQWLSDIIGLADMGKIGLNSHNNTLISAIVIY